MSMMVYDNLTNKLYKSEDVQLADKVIQKKKDKDLWDVIGDLVDAWAKRTPEEFRAFKVYLDNTRSGLYDKEFGQTKYGKQMERRLTMIIPEPLIFMIRSIYKADELPMNKEFYAEFLNRFPFFKIPNKI